MISDTIRPGEKMELRLVSDDPASPDKINKIQDIKIYITRVHDILENDYIELTMPLEQGRLVLLPQGQKLDCIFYAKTGIFQCGGVVTDRYKTDNIYLLKVRPTSELRIKQNREFYRCDCLLKMEVAKMTVKDNRDISWQELELMTEEDAEMEECVVLDISGGGMRFVCVETFDVEDTLHLRFALTVGGIRKTYNLPGRIKRCEPHPRRKGEFVHSAQFMSVTDRDQQDIVRFVFQEEIRRKNAMPNK